MDAPAQQSGPDITELVGRVPALRLLLSTAGIAGVFIAIGAIVEAAQASLLGMSGVAGGSATEYATSGGKFLVDLLPLIWRHPWLTGFAVAVVIAVAAFMIFGPKRTKHWRRRRVWVAGFAAITIAFLLKSALLDLPYIGMHDLLEKPPICEGMAALRPREHDVWERFLCTRNDPTLTQKLEANGLACSETTLHHETPRQQKLHEALHSSFTIEQEFTLNIFVTCFLTYAALLLYVSTPQLSRLAVELVRILLLVMTMGAVLAVPYVYGKVIRSTRFPFGHVVYESLDDDLKAEPRNAAALLIGSDGDTITFYDLELQRFFHIPRSKVYWTDTTESQDLVAKRVGYFLDTSPCNRSTQ